MSIFSRKTSVNIVLLSINLILLAIISRVVIAEESTNAILENSIYLYYYESDDALLDVGESQLYTFAPIPGEDITIVSYGLDDSARSSISLFDNNNNEVATGTTNQVTEPSEDPDAPLQSPYITAIQHTANSSGLYYFEVKNEAGKSGLIRTMLFVGQPFDTDLTLIDELNPLLPSKAFMVAGDPDREWINELTGETEQGLRTEIDVLPIERIDRTPDVFLSHSTLSYLPNVTERLQPVKLKQWFNKDNQEIYLVNIRPIPEEETDSNRAILASIDYQTYNSNNFFFFEYLFSVGNGSDPIALDRGAGACAGLADRIDCVSNDSNFGRETTSSTETTTTTAAATIADTAQVTVQGSVVTAVIDRTKTCATFTDSGGTQSGNPVTLTAQGSTVPTTVCVPSSYIPSTGTFTTGTFTAGMGGALNTCTGTANADALLCTNGNDNIQGLAGNDAIIADAGNDTINGGDGDDFILAGSGDDTVYGGTGIDSVDGGTGNDIINLEGGGGYAIGGTGTDTFIIDSSHVTGDNTILAGGASLSILADGEQDTFDFNGDPTGTLTLYTESVDQLDFAGYGSGTGVIINPGGVTGSGLTVTINGVVPSNISGSAFDDTVNLSTSFNNLNIDGNAGADTINTGFGADTIDGGDDDDIINSGSGNDTIIANDGDGSDTIDGGAGTDLIDNISGSNPLIVIFNNATGSIKDTVTGDIDLVSNVENINTGSGLDLFFISDIDNNIINAGDGDDVATISGGSGTITVTRTGEDVAVSDTGFGIGTDQYNSVYQVNVSGSATDDTFVVSDANDNIFNGLGGTDSIDYATTSEDIRVEFYDTNTAQVSGTSIGNDTLINFEIISTDSGDDYFLFDSDAGTVTINSRAGDDIFDFDDASGTLVLNDTSGNTFLDFRDYTDGAVIDLASNSQQTVSLSDSSLLVTLNGTFNNVSGSAFDDNISGTSVADTIYGGAGADQIYGEGGNDFLYGEDGNDIIDGGAGDDTIDGGDGNDDIDGGTGTDYINESDRVNPLIVVLSNTAGVGYIEDTVTGEIDMVDNVENVDTGDGLDLFFIDDIDDNIINAGAGDDVATISGGSGTITVTRTGEDVAVSDTGFGIGTDQYNSVYQVNVSGSGTNDTFVVSDANDNIFNGLGGTDSIDYATTSEDISVEFTSANTAQVSGTSIGNDTLINFEIISTDSGDDYFLFDSDVGTVTINSRAGDDIFDFDDASGTLVLNDTSGNTFLDFRDYTDGAVIDLSSNSQQTVSLSDSSLLVTLNGTFNNVSGSAFDDNISGTSVADTIYGGAGADQIYGQGGNDILYGEDGNDIIDGGAGDDTLVGGAGNDDIDGGTGTDFIDDSDSSNPLIVVLSNTAGVGYIEDTVTGEIDTVDNVENVDTGDGLDLFFIDDIDDNIINAGAGNDVATISGGSGTITVTRTGEDVAVSDTGGGIGTDQYNSVYQVNISGSTGNDIVELTDENDNIITGNGGTDTVNVAKNTETDGTITITRSGADVSVSGTGIGSDTYNAISLVNVTGSGQDDTFELADGNDNIITGNGGTDIVNVSSTAGSTGETITIIRTGSNVAVNGTVGIGNDNYNDIDEVNITAGSGDDTFNIFDTLDNTFDGGDGIDTANYAPTTFDMTVILDGSSSYTITGTGVGTDILLNIENINTGSGNDTITVKDIADNTINGGGNTGGGIDVLTDIMEDGYSGIITIIRSPSNVVTVSGSGFGTDVFTDIEQVNVTSVDGDDVFRPSDVNDNIFDGGAGTDWIDYSTITDTSVSMNVNLSTGIATGDGTDTLANFENISGSIGNDTLTGDNNDNIIDGYTGNDIINAGGGDDTIIGGEGNDDIDGGAGTDSIDASSTSNPLIVVLSNTAGVGYIEDTVTGEIDTVDNVENVDTGSGDDQFFISDSDDNIINAGGETTADVATITDGTGTITITRDGTGVTVSDGSGSGGIGNDRYNGVELINVSGSNTDDTFVVDDANNNVFDGQGGTDTISYASISTPILVTIISNQATISATATGIDVLYNIENITTGSGADTFDITGTVDYGLDSGSGADIFDFNNNVEGALTLATSDSAHLDFQDYDAGIVIDLSSGVSQTIDTDLTVTLSGTFTSISGSAFADDITGTDFADLIYGGGGADIIDGGDGDDVIYGGAGNDYIDGGAGTELIDASTTSNPLIVVLSNITGVGYIEDTVTGEIDNLDNVENIDTGSGLDLFYISDSDNNIINAGAGNDVATVTGGSGTITITRTGGDVAVSDTGGGIGTDQYNSVYQVNVSGSDSDDTFVVDDSSDNILDGGAGTDTISYELLATPITVTIISNQATISATSGIGNDTLYNFENITTGSGADYFDITGTVDYGLDSGSGADIFDFNNSVDGTLTLATSDTAHLDFQDYDAGIIIDLSSGALQEIDTDLFVSLSGTFTSISGTAFADNITGTGIADIIYGGDGADFLYGGNGDDFIYGGAGNDYIDGGAGTELIDDSTNTNPLVVVLSNTAGVGYIEDTVTGEIDNLDNIENINTGGGDDQFFISDSDDNTINAGGETTADVATVTGGTGTITITRDGTGVTVSDGSGSGGIGNDRYNGVELINVSGSNTDDTFVVDDANDNIFDGDAGTDTISYAALSTPITVTIVSNQATITAATGIGTDTLYNIENIFTGTGDDYFDISGAVDYGLDSSSGADIFYFNDGVNGTLTLATSATGTHLDFSSFTSTGISIDLSSTATQAVTGVLDITLSGTFTSISGTTMADNISGTDQNDTIWADDGADTIYGGDGDDTIYGGEGDDYIDGGAGTELIDESANTTGLVVTLSDIAGAGSIVDGSEVDTVDNIENVTTGIGNDTFYLSDSDVNVITAGTGTDTVTIFNAINVTISRTVSGDVVNITDNATGVGNDIYYGVEQVNVSGTSGDDTFQMADEFDNIINGQGGTNTVDYSLITAAITVNVLATDDITVASTGIGNDTLISIQNVTTGDGDDTFVIEENSINNVFDAANGTDTATYTAAGTISATNSGSSLLIQVSGSNTDQLDNFETVDFVGSVGDDTFIIQDTNNNTIDGAGAGADNDTYDASFATNDITVTTGASVTAVGTDIGTDTLIDIESITTGSGDDTFIIDTDLGGTFFFNAGESGSLGNIFQFTGNGGAVTNITITSSATARDILDFSGFTSGLDIDLNTTTITSGNLLVTFDSFIDDVIGTDQADTITGNSLSNNISGGGGDDTIYYSAGNDVIDGGTGNDTVDYLGAPDAISATISSSGISVAISGTTDTNTLTYVENISGTNNDDTFNINDAVSTTINAQGGTDTVDYSGLSDAINVDLSTGVGSVSGTSSSDDHTLIDVEDVMGSLYDDTIIGNADNNNLNGNDGNDSLDGKGGNDVIDGGNGTDTVSYQSATSSVNVNLSTGSSSGGGGNDTLSNIENVSGSSFDDNITGTTGDNVIYGGEGNDEIYGLAGNDTIYGGSLSAVSGTSDDGSDTIYGGDGDDTIYGGNNNTGGGTGNDNADGGNDVIEGGDGDDTIYGGNNNTNGGSGNDGDDIISDIDPLSTGPSKDTDTVYGDNNNTNGGSGDAGTDSIDVDDNDNDDDEVYGDNNNTGGGTGADDGNGSTEITHDGGDNTDEGNNP